MLDAFVLDRKDPKKLVLLANYQAAPLNIGHIALRAGYAFVAGLPGLIIDISDPQSPCSIASYPCGSLFFFEPDLSFSAILHPEGLDIVELSF